MNTEREPLKPYEICLGNFIESMGKVELVTGIVREEGNNFRIGHTGWNAGDSLMPEDVTYSTYPIPLTEHWKVCFCIEKENLPEWIKYVHQVQQYFVLAFNKNLCENLDWDLLPREVELNYGV